MSGKRHRENDSFIQFLMDNYRNAAGELEPKATHSHLADAMGKSRPLIQKYNDNGLDDLGKRIELVKLCRIDIPLFLQWIASEITRRSA